MNPEIAIKKERISFFKSYCAALGTFSVLKSPEKDIALFFKDCATQTFQRAIATSKYVRKCWGVFILMEISNTLDTYHQTYLHLHMYNVDCYPHYIYNKVDESITTGDEICP